MTSARISAPARFTLRPTASLLRNALKPALAAVAALWLGALPASADTAGIAFSETQKEALDAAIREYILNNPEILVESLNSMQQRQQQAEQERQQKAISQLQDRLIANPVDPVMGNPDGSVTVVEFFDYQCGYCKRMVGPIQQLLKDDPDVRWVMKEFPVLGQASVTASRAALAALKQGAYQEFHVALMRYRGRLTDAAVFQTAREVGLDMEKLRADMKPEQTDATIDDAITLASAIGVNGTPAFVINGEIIPGAVSLNVLKQRIAAARKG